ncbi:hypothetical protein K491DRAFT_694335 [Lophiostoma macrostomum CBS 122681]|uniref:Zn(2)-C6 fungal-type domain-containing protein n=1 Tax=Lophiostoma macrostomum CBS 122681 TaxID=1314788 RepID=A0A6A6T3M7_9PLEO|nr:hypothetical protein K491DRAFT_694335 [Lophiostoma macrostomum CBS 122681]
MKKKRTRASHPKVRTGCHTCKIRRVKCDERRPECQKCTSTGRKCEGYQNNREWIVIVAPPVPMTDGFEDDRSRRHFDYFRSHAVYELSWFFDGGQWGNLVLKESHSSSAVRHAVIALACSHEDFRDHSIVISQAPQYAFAAQNYSRAIRHLIKETSDSAQESRMRALICGLLFISIEILRGNHVAALSHLMACLNIVKEAQARMGVSSLTSGTHALEHDRHDSEAHLREEIIPMFARLDVQSSFVLGRKTQTSSLFPPIWEPCSQTARASNPIQVEEPPITGFATIIQACNTILQTANRIHRFTSYYSDLYRQQLVRPIPLEVLTEKAILYDELMQWEKGIKPLIDSCETRRDWGKLTLMRIHNRTALTLLESCLHVEEMHLDNFAWVFEDIVNYTADLHNIISRHPYPNDDGSSSDSESSATPEPDRSSVSGSLHSRPIGTRCPLKHRDTRCFFLLDNGVIFSLFWAALKARDGLLRRRAVSLLEQSSQEGIWIGPIQAAIARRVIEIEEERPYQQYPPSEHMKKAKDIPEYIRVHGVHTEIDKLRRRAKIITMQRLQGDEGDWSKIMDWVSW